jgi:type VI protein secretion system component VasK
MVARTAYAQLHYSPLLLAGTVAGMALIYLAAPLIILTFFACWNFAALFYAVIACALMAYTYWPTLKLYDRAPWEAALLPVAAALYTAMTVSSALRHWQGQGGQWKGRTYS